MSLAEQFRQEGRQEGLIRANQAAILEALEVRFERVPEGLREEIQLIDNAAKLQALHRAAITSPTLHAFAGSL